MIEKVNKGDAGGREIKYRECERISIHKVQKVDASPLI